MSGHSKWSTIKRQKGATDAKRGAVFTKLGNAIAVATREGGSGDPDSNFKLRLAIEKARAANMPKENIQRSIDRGLGKGEGTALENALYEGFGPAGAAIIVETITDNKTRTGSQLRALFEKHGGTLGGPGAVSYLFTHLGEVEVGKQGQTFDAVFEKAVEAGAQDVEENPDSFLIYTAAADLHKVKEALDKAGLTVVESSPIYRPNKETMTTVSGPEKKQQLESFLESIGDLDDVQEVYTNVSFD